MVATSRWRKLLKEREEQEYCERLYKRLFCNNFNDIDFEITRKCNLKCRHCMRGDEQNITMSKEVIDKFFSQTKYIRAFLVTGGEPFINEEIFEYMVDSIIKHEIFINGVSMITNGTIRSERIVKALNKLIYYCGIKNRFKSQFFCYVGVSDDMFHTEQIGIDTIIKTRDFYKERVIGNKFCKLVVDLKSTDSGEGLPIDIISDSEVKDSRLILNAGKAKENHLGFWYQNKMNHRIEFDVESNDFVLCGEHIDIPFVKCPIIISANGNWGLGCHSEFNSSDDNAIGNLLTDEKNITDMIKDYNEYKCICSCYEASEYSDAEFAIVNNYYKNHDKHGNDINTSPEEMEENKLYYHKQFEKYNRLFDIRKKIRNNIKNVDYDKLEELSYDEYLKQTNLLYRVGRFLEKMGI